MRVRIARRQSVEGSPQIRRVTPCYARQCAQRGHAEILRAEFCAGHTARRCSRGEEDSIYRRRGAEAQSARRGEAACAVPTAACSFFQSSCRHPPSPRSFQSRQHAAAPRGAPSAVPWRGRKGRYSRRRAQCAALQCVCSAGRRVTRARASRSGAHGARMHGSGTA